MNAQMAAHSWANRHPEKLIILRECEHEGKKHKHHPDYSKPFEIELLCCRCHGKHIKDNIKNRKLSVSKKQSKQNNSGMLKTDVIEKYRINNNISKSELAKKLQMLPSNYTMMMDSKSTSLKTIYKIARLFKISAKKLIED